MPASTSYNPSNDPTVKLNHKDSLSLGVGEGYKAGKEIGTDGKCEDTAGCTWTYRYVVGLDNDVLAGSYPVEITAYKGESVEVIERTFEISGVTPITPRILSVDKKVYKADCSVGTQTDGSYEDCREWESARDVIDYVNPVLDPNSEDTQYIYTNTPELQIYTASEPLSQVTATISIPTGDIVVTAQADVRGVTTLPLVDLTGVADGQYPVTISADWNGILSPDADLETILVYDTTAPSLDYVVTDTTSDSKPFSTNPWLTPGDAVEFTFNTDEPIWEAVVFNEVGGGCVSSGTNFELFDLGNCDPANPNNSFNLENEYSLSSIVDPRTNDVVDCSTYTVYELTYLTYGVPYICHYTYLIKGEETAALTISGASSTGVYYPTIYLEDLAGNKVFVSNTDPSSVMTNANVPSEYKYESSSLAEHGNSATIEVDNVRNALIAGDTSTLSASELEIVNGNGNTSALPDRYPYNHTPRGRSLDFTLFVDGTDTVLPTKVLTGWGDLVDGVCSDEGITGVDLPEVDRNLTGDAFFSDFDPSSTNNPENYKEVVCISKKNLFKRVI